MLTELPATSAGGGDEGGGGGGGASSGEGLDHMWFFSCFTSIGWSSSLELFKVRENPRLPGEAVVPFAAALWCSDLMPRPLTGVRAVPVSLGSLARIEAEATLEGVTSTVSSFLMAL